MVSALHSGSSRTSDTLSVGLGAVLNNTAAFVEGLANNQRDA